MVFLWFSYGFPMVFLWFSYGFPMVFLWFSYGFPLVFLWFSDGFPMVFLWFSYGFPMVCEPLKPNAWIPPCKIRLLVNDDSRRSVHAAAGIRLVTCKM